MQLVRISLILLASWLTVVCECDPVVTLDHGGQLVGLQTTYNNQPVDLFLGIPYAQPPVGSLRFEKPEPVQAWSGVKNATASGAACTQDDLVGNMIGQEDCLFLDITVPGEVNSGAMKPVMVYIHGGGYYAGQGTTYIGGPLATHGDVIIVSINYRLGIFGFLSDGPGTGNFGLWDQRAAILWVKENIEQFGGDPDMITLFGESAGGSSIAAQTVSPHNDGLFTRAIEQSGALFVPWSWYLSLNERQRVASSVRDSTACQSSGKVYECLADLSTEEVHRSYVLTDPFHTPWLPVPDNDFFPQHFDENPNYELSKRFDLLAGMNRQEGAIEVLYEVGGFAAATNRSITNGVCLKLAKDFLKHTCGNNITPLSPELCADFVVKTYKLDKARSDKTRGVRLSYFLGELGYDSGAVDLLQQHQGGDKSTYAYYFTERYDLPENPVFSLPGWLKRSAAHLEELPFLFGSAFIKDESSPVWKELLSKDWLVSIILDESLGSNYQPFSRDMMQFWTNFAKTGNPNTPFTSSACPYPEWPEFGEGRFMRLNSASPEVIDTPNGWRLEQLMNTVLAARDLQVLADIPADVCVS